jgi:monothiol glutaredoxin
LGKGQSRFERLPAVSDIAEANTIHGFIAKAIADHPVVLFMKGVPDQPQCGFSAICVQILDHLGGEFVGGSDIVREMFQTGELKPLLIEKGVLAA